MIEMPEDAILVRHFQGKASASDDAAIEKWRDHAAENQAVYQHLRLIWEEAGNPDTIPTVDLDKGWRNLSQDLGLADAEAVSVQSMPIAHPAARRRWSTQWLAVAAVLVAGLLGLWFSGALTPSAEEFVTAVGERRELVLEDGTKVWLDSATKLSHERGFAGEARRVSLDGHAYFEVTHDAKSFIVETPSATVRVLGTAFDVWAGNGKTKVVVREGRVSLRGLASSQAVELGPNQYSECTASGKPQMPQDYQADALLAWLKGSRAYHQEPLKDVALDLSRLFGKSITVGDVELAEQTITATFRNESLPEILEEICLTLNMEYIEEEGGITLKPAR